MARIDLPANLVHVICHYHRQWIPADERGFRSRGHRIHSSGDYRDPPPPDEHEGLRYHVKGTMKGKAVTLRKDQRGVVGAAFVHKLLRLGCEVIILACGPTHLHALISPTDEPIDRQIGKAKQFASLKCPNRRGQLWGENCEARAVEGREHARELFSYIRDHVDEGAWVWRVDRDPPPPKPR
jgi:REP element-mobilizing transposase RayT